MATPATTTRFSIAHLHGFADDILRAAGLSPDAAACVAGSLCAADARGISSHGVVRLLPVYVYRLRKGTTNPRPEIRVVQQRAGVAVIDGDGGPGQVVGRTAMDLAIDKARATGIGAVAVRNSSHYGIGARYAEQATSAGMIGIGCTNATPNMPPAGGRGRYFGTNPLTIGIPREDDRPIMLDMSTSVVARGKIVMAEKEGSTIPPGWAIDVEGRQTSDPATALLGAMLPLAGYKGAGLALMIDVLSGVLSGAAFGEHVVDLYDDGDRHQDVGHFFMALAVDAFMPRKTFNARIRQFADEVRAQPRQPDIDRIYLPGELEYEAEAVASTAGVPISSAGVAELTSLARQLNVMPLDAYPKDALGDPT